MFEISLLNKAYILLSAKYRVHSSYTKVRLSGKVMAMECVPSKGIIHLVTKLFLREISSLQRPLVQIMYDIENDILRQTLK